MSESDTVITLTAADFTDTGQWRLIVYVSHRGMSAYLKHLSDTTKPVVVMFNVSWQPAEGAELLSKIENTIYDHPGVLDDYATDIVVETDYTTFAPTSILNDVEDSEFTIFESLFPDAGDDVTLDTTDDITALFSLTPGLEDFISRTMPGTRIRSHLAILAAKFRRQTADMPRLYIDIREDAADILAFDDSKLLSASTQTWHAREDIAYRIFNLMNLYDINPAEAKICVSGSKEIKRDVIAELRKYCGFVTSTNLPGGAAKEAMPTAALLLAY